MIAIRLALSRGGACLDPATITPHAWQRNAQPGRNHVSMGNVLAALQHSAAQILACQYETYGEVRLVVKGYTPDGVCLHVVVGFDNARKIRVITYWDPAMPKHMEAVQLITVPPKPQPPRYMGRAARRRFWAAVLRRYHARMRA